ncbi:MAG: penicillin-insensitive murein endopeptidase [Bradymonadia bacterium]
MHISRLFCLFGCLVFGGQTFATPAALLDHGRPSDLFDEQGLTDEYAPSVPLSLVGITPSKPLRFPSQENRAIVNVSYETIDASTPAQQPESVTTDAVPNLTKSRMSRVVPNSTRSTIKRVHVIGKPPKGVPQWPHSVALGKPYRGWLYNPVQLNNTARIKVRKHRNYATSETVNAIQTAVDAVHSTFKNTPRLPIGNISRKAGGRFPPHKSHQNGRDADIAYYLRIGHHPLHLKVATARTLDVPRTWVFLESMIKRGEIEVAFIDYRLQKPLYEYATQTRGWSVEQMKNIMSYPHGRGERNALIRHLKGHHDHMHVRFNAPNSVAAVDELIARYGRKILKPVPVYTRIRSGDSLWKLARRHRVTVSKLRQWNGRKRTRVLRVGRKLITGWRRPSLSELKGSS